MQTLRHFKTFVDEITANNSRNYKMDILRKYDKDEEIRVYLNFIYNPYIVTGISDKKMSKKLDESLDDDVPFRCMFNVMEYLLEHNTGRDIDIYLVKAYKLFIIDDDLWDLYDAVITKNLQIGVDVLSINKCMGNFIPTFSVQLANKYFEKPEVIDGKTFALSTKIDGSRIIALKENNEVHFYTRAGQPYEGLVDLENEMLEKLPDNICLDGEITLLDKGNLTSKDQYKETMKRTRKDGEKHGVKMLVFDCMTAEEFKTQNCSTPYFARRADLLDYFTRKNLEYYYSKALKELHENLTDEEYREKLLELINKNYTYFQILPILYEGNDQSKITEILNEQVQKGEEGIMINVIHAPYCFKRCSTLLKCKLMKDMDLEVVGFEEGSGSNKNKLGAFLVRYKEGNIVKVGSGFSKEYREEVWKHPEDYIGRVITVQYFEETQNQNGGLSLRFPVFISERTDKKADY